MVPAASPLKSKATGFEFELERRGATLLPHQAAGIRDGHRERHFLAAIDGGPVGLERAVETGEREPHGDLVELELLAAALVDITERAIVEPHVVELEPTETGAAARRRGGRGRRRGGSGRGRTELPVGPALLVDLEVDDRIDQRQLGDLEPTAQQRHHLEVDIKLAKLRHVRTGRAWRVGEGHVLRLERDARQDREGDRAIDAEVAAGRLFHLGDELGLERVDRDEEGYGNDRDNQQKDEDADPDQQFLHGLRSPSRCTTALVVRSYYQPVRRATAPVRSAPRAH